MEHRMKHRLQLVANPNAPEASNKHELTDLKKRLAALDHHRARSRSPRRQQQAPAGDCWTFVSRPSGAGFVFFSAGTTYA